MMRFSDLQKKEVIEVKKGSFLGFVQDATIDMKNGKIDVLQIGGAERSLFLESKMKDLKQIKYDDVLTIGKDIVLVGKKTDK
ncbi:PRC-barrel domain-containing protein [Sporosarcina koreensis]|uniref:PRC-barrel domain-containing protein n=2 Tax=Bacilli TaxID=91061 RepID=UPI0009EB6DC7|nr:YlmC/YmxH family sporulation protein [Sporosarcina koreensis]